MNKRLRLKIIEKFDYQRDFAQAVKVDDSFVSRVIRGRRSLPEEKRREWAQALDCRPEDVFADA